MKNIKAEIKKAIDDFSILLGEYAVPRPSRQGLKSHSARTAVHVQHDCFIQIRRQRVEQRLLRPPGDRSGLGVLRRGEQKAPSEFSGQYAHAVIL